MDVRIVELSLSRASQIYAPFTPVSWINAFLPRNRLLKTLLRGRRIVRMVRDHAPMNLTDRLAKPTHHRLPRTCVPSQR